MHTHSSSQVHEVPRTIGATSAGWTFLVRDGAIRDGFFLSSWELIMLDTRAGITTFLTRCSGQIWTIIRKHRASNSHTYVILWRMNERDTRCMRFSRSQTKLVSELVVHQWGVEPPGSISWTVDLTARLDTNVFSVKPKYLVPFTVFYSSSVQQTKSILKSGSWPTEMSKLTEK